MLCWARVETCRFHCPRPALLPAAGFTRLLPSLVCGSPFPEVLQPLSDHLPSWAVWGSSLRSHSFPTLNVEPSATGLLSFISVVVYLSNETKLLEGSDGRFPFLLMVSTPCDCVCPFPSPPQHTWALLVGYFSSCPRQKWSPKGILRAHP